MYVQNIIFTQLKKNKPMPRVFVTIAGPSYLGSWQPDYDTGLWLVGARPKPGLLLGNVSY